jgi:hypothetical protein
VKQESPSAPPRRSSDALVIREGARTSSPPRNRKRKPRKDDAKAASDLADAEATRAEEAAMREAITKSLADLVPVENSMQMDAALAWSRQDWEREQAEQQRWLLDLAQARRRTKAAALPARGAPVVKLEDSSDDDLYRPTPPRFKYIMNSAYICKNSPIYINISKFHRTLNVFRLILFDFEFSSGHDAGNMGLPTPKF